MVEQGPRRSSVSLTYAVDRFRMRTASGLDIRMPLTYDDPSDEEDESEVSYGPHSPCFPRFSSEFAPKNPTIVFYALLQTSMSVKVVPAQQLSRNRHSKMVNGHSCIQIRIQPSAR